MEGLLEWKESGVYAIATITKNNVGLRVDGETIILYFENRAIGTTERLSENCDGHEFTLFCMK